MFDNTKGPHTDMADAQRKIRELEQVVHTLDKRITLLEKKIEHLAPLFPFLRNVDSSILRADTPEKIDAIREQRKHAMIFIFIAVGLIFAVVILSHIFGWGEQ